MFLSSVHEGRFLGVPCRRDRGGPARSLARCARAARELHSGIRQIPRQELADPRGATLEEKAWPVSEKSRKRSAGRRALPFGGGQAFPSQGVPRAVRTRQED